ncbi:hypothetical protein CYY_005420 [Polysphondylium violaceum]|uniref:Uncharacterized protein n=1 Tax=Polysphondylium violaceum TaxID=133409 RepID=A0A8J4UZL7_9MYCE|nr:hypothetical protein CYY_005420 [Polysphondylium violaceum]
MDTTNNTITTNRLDIIAPKDIDINKFLKELGVAVDKSTTLNNFKHQVDTKYYIAEIDIHVLGLDKLDHSQDTNLVFLVFDHSNQQSLTDIQQYYEKLSKAKKEKENDNNQDDNDEQEKEIDNDDEDEDEQDILYVLIDINLDDNSNNEFSTDIKVEEWCVEQLVEYVISNTKRHEKYDMIRSELEEIDTSIKYGMNRIKEILETTMWPAMNFKSESKPNNQKEAKVVEKEKDIIKDPFLLESLQKVEKMIKSNVSDNSNNNSNKQQQQQQQQKQEEEEEDHEDDGKDFDNMEGTLKELQNLRQHLQKLPDQERREMAARVAMMFASSLGFNDDDDE